VPNPLKWVIRWWLSSKLPADLKAGDICLVASGDGGYKIAKVLVMDGSAIHIRLYKQRFSEIPRLINTSTLSLGTIHDAEFGMGHLPVSRGSFASWAPIRFQNEPVTEEELDGYRIWEGSKGGTWD